MLSRLRGKKLFDQLKEAHEAFRTSLKSRDDPEFEEVESRYKDLLKEAKQNFEIFSLDQQEFISGIDRIFASPQTKLLIRHERSRSRSRLESTMDGKDKSDDTLGTAMGDFTPASSKGEIEIDAEKLKFLKERDERFMKLKEMQLHVKEEIEDNEEAIDEQRRQVQKEARKQHRALERKRLELEKAMRETRLFELEGAAKYSEKPEFDDDDIAIVSVMLKGGN